MPSAIGSALGGIGKAVGGIAKSAGSLLSSPVGQAALSFLPVPGAQAMNPLFSLGTTLAGNLIGQAFAPDPPTFSRQTPGATGGGFLPKGTTIANPLFSTKQKISGDTIDVTSDFTDLGERRRGTFEGLFDREAAALQGFDREGQIDEQQALLKKIFDQQFQAERTALFDQLNAQGGGVLATPGGRDLLGRFASNAAVTRAQNDLAAFDRAVAEEDRLKGLESAALKQLVEFENIGPGQVDAAREVGRVAASGNQALAAQNFNTEAEKFAADSGLVSEIFKGVTTGIGSIFSGGTPPIIGSKAGVPASSRAGGFGMDFRKPSPFSSTRQQFSLFGV